MTALLVVLFWIVAAGLVVAAHGIVALGAILLTAYGYTRVAARNRGVTHALTVGIVWLALSIAAELSLRLTLLGTPDHPLLRNVFLFVWIFAPALFARSDD